MMISPETYVKLELDGLSNDEIISKIRGLKREMARLKREAEYVGLEDDKPVIICPSPVVRIMLQRDYIEAARKFLEAQGGELPFTKEEIKVRVLVKLELKHDLVQVIWVLHGQETKRKMV